MRVAILCPYSLSRPGGVQGQVLGLARALRTLGHDATVLAPADGPLVDTGLPPGAVVVLGRSLALPANGSVAPVALGPGASWRAVRALRRGDFDVLHLHEPLAPGPSYACLVAAPQPRVGTFHRAGGSAFYRALGPLARWAANRLAVRCAVSAEAEATASEALGGEYLVVGNGVELDRYADAPPWPTEGPTILFIGRHEDRKGLAVLLQAFEDLPPDHPATLWIAGDGPERDVLERRHPAGPTRQWLGRIPDDELASRLRGADILCAPSLRGESFGVILLEAMAAGAALVASDLPGYAAVAGDHALLVPPGDTAALTAALADLIADASAGTGRCSSEALEAALDHAGRWSMTALAERYVEIYAQVVAG